MVQAATSQRCAADSWMVFHKRSIDAWARARHTANCVVGILMALVYCSSITSGISTLAY